MDSPLNFAMPPSPATRQDPDWSQVRETIQMLNLAVAQIEVALKDSNGAVEVLAKSFTGMYGHLMALVDAAQVLPDSPVKQSIEQSGRVVSDQMQHAIVAFQFYDRLSQRLSHASHALDDLSGIVSDPTRLSSPIAWHALQQQIRARYTMEDEKLLFDTLIETGNVQVALDAYVKLKQQQAGNTADVELF